MLLLQAGHRRTITVVVSWPFHYVAVIMYLGETATGKNSYAGALLFGVRQKKFCGKDLIKKVDLEVVRLDDACHASLHSFCAMW